MSLYQRRRAAALLGLVFVCLFVTGCRSDTQSDSERQARISNESPQMQNMRKDKRGD